MSGGRRPRRPSGVGLVPAVLSASALFLAVVTVPVVLWLAAGWPLAHLDYRQSVHVLSSRRSFDTILAVHWLGRLAIGLCWVTWLWTTVCVALEVRSWATGLRPVRLPASTTLQAAVACLVGTALAVSGGRITVPASPAPTASSAFGSPAPAVTVIDDLLAYDHALPDGWDVPAPARAGGLLPVPRLGPVDDADAPLPAPAPAVVERPDAGWHRVLPRETLWSIAGDRLGSPSRWRELAEVNYGIVQSDGGVLSGDHWVTPGWLLRLPGVTGVASHDGGWPRPSAEGSDPGPGDEHTPVGRPVQPVGGIVMGAGVVNILDRMRRAQQRHRGEERLIVLPEGPLADVERRLRVGDGRGVVVEIDRALRALADRWHAPGGRSPGVRGVRVREIDIEILLTGTATDAPLPEGFSLDPAGTSIRLERSRIGRDPVHVAPEPGLSPAPLLVTAGRGTDHDVMVNLEVLGSLIVEGDGAGPDAVVRALALELATSFWGGSFDLVLVGFGFELERFTRVVATTDTQDLVRTLCHRRIKAHHALRSAGYGSFAEARAITGAPGWDPVVVIVGPAQPRAEVEELLDSCADSTAGMTVVATAGSGTGRRQVVLCGPRSDASLDLLGSVLVPPSVSADEQSEVTALLDLAADVGAVAKAPGPSTLHSSPVSGFEQDPARTRLPLRPGPDVTPAARPVFGVATGDTPTAPGTVQVNVLGPIRVDGADRPFSRAWALELVVYLAMHPQGATNEAWATALWPDRLMAPSSLHSTASVARRALGKNDLNEDHLPRAHGRLAVSASVTTDWARFEVLASSADVEDRRSALELIRGRPFEGLRSSDWVILEGIGPGIEAFVVDTSGRVAGSCLAAGDPDGATWAARKGLLVSPYDERLYRMLMRAADLGGNPAGVESAMAELVQLVADDVEPFDSVHPATIDLYRSLTRRKETGLRPDAVAAGGTGRRPEGQHTIGRQN